jgi:hypothetical protein
VSAHPRRLRCRLGRAAGLAVAAACALAAPGQAVVFGPKEPVGRFKVVSGTFKQKVEYLASYSTTPSSQGECWTYQMNDKGAAKYDLTFDEGEVSTLKYILGQVTFRPALQVSGPVSRSYSSTVEKQPGPSAGDPGCLPADWDAQDGTGCGKEKLKGAATALSVGLTRKGTPNPAGTDGTLSGLILRDDPFTPCPTDSSYSLLAAGGDSAKGAQELDDVKVGDSVTLKGHESLGGPGPKGFQVPFDWIAGSQQVSVDWSLKLKRLKNKKG